MKKGFVIAIIATVFFGLGFKQSSSPFGNFSIRYWGVAQKHDTIDPFLINYEIKDYAKNPLVIDLKVGTYLGNGATLPAFDAYLFESGHLQAVDSVITSKKISANGTRSIPVSFENSAWTVVRNAIPKYRIELHKRAVQKK